MKNPTIWHTPTCMKETYFRAKGIRALLIWSPALGIVVRTHHLEHNSQNPHSVAIPYPYSSPGTTGCVLQQNTHYGPKGVFLSCFSDDAMSMATSGVFPCWQLAMNCNFQCQFQCHSETNVEWPLICFWQWCEWTGCRCAAHRSDHT